MKKKYLLILLISLFLISSATIYFKYISPTKIALVNYPEFLYTKIARSSDHYFIQTKSLDPKKLSNLKKYDMLLIFGMGLKLTADQETYIKEVGEKGVPIYLQSSTNKALKLTNVNDEQKEIIKAYLDNAGKKNYKNLLHYIRTKIDNKTAFTDTAAKPLEIASNVLFHKDEHIAFEKVKDFENYCLEKNIHKKGNNKVILFTSIPGPFNANREHLNSLIDELESRNINLYPVSGFRGRLNYMKEINPDLIIYMPHGRLTMGGSSKAITSYLKKLNVPVLCPVTVHQRYNEWLTDKQGMHGGLLSQSVTMPEFDGGIVPYAVFAQYEDEKGYLLFKAIPNRLKKFGEITENYLKLKKMDNSQKKLAVVYFKGPGKNAMVAANMEVLPSLHNMLLSLKKEGYDLGNLPEDYPSFEKIVLKEGPVLGPYAEGAFDQYLKTGNPELVEISIYNNWCKEILPESLIKDVENRYGKAPGSYMAVYKNQKEHIAVTRVRFGNIVLLPQPLPGLGNDHFKLVHGAKVAPPHTYIAPYLWIQKGFKADAIFHFGTHGSLEFTPGKQIALSDYDWTDPLIGVTPHSYIYTISNIGEAMIAKRRSYAATVTYLTPPFIEAKASQNHQVLQNKLNKYYGVKGAIKNQYAISAKELIVKNGIHLDLGLDSIMDQPYSKEEMDKVANYLAELEHEKITGGLYTMGIPYSKDKLKETTLMMHIDALAYNIAEIDILKGKIKRSQLDDKPFFRNKYLSVSRAYIKEILRKNNIKNVHNTLIVANELKQAKEWQAAQIKAKMEARKRRMAAMRASADSKKEKGKYAKVNHPTSKAKAHATGHSHSINKDAKVEKGKNKDQKQEQLMQAILNLDQALKSILKKKGELENSPSFEMQNISNVLNGGYVHPSSGGDPVGNPESVPTGRNLYSINAEQTPTKEAWKVAKKLTHSLLNDYQSKHNGEYPQKISFTLWGGSFIESEGTTIAQILYMLGVEPIWTPRGKVNDIRLIPEEELGRPRIDVVVQTSGQARDLAASRLFMINRAIAMAAEASSKNNKNFVAKGKADAEKFLIEKGLSPKEARELSVQRVFGGVNGNYGAAIMGMVENSDRWDSTQSVARTYINNMGAVYGQEDNWGAFSKGIFEAALLNTEAVVQPRHGNNWGALSLDHVYEFMGGLNLAVKEVTGKDAESYFNDFRNSSNPRIQSLKEAIGIESKTTLLNPRYIKEYMKGGATSAESFAETFRNTFGWNVMKPSVIENKLWNDLYDVYVEDKLQLDVHSFFEKENPYALQEMTAVMLETVRKGFWKASQEQIKEMSKLHAELVKKHEAGCSGFVCDNAKLRDFISQNLNKEIAQSYNKEITSVREAPKEKKKENVVLKQEKNEKVDNNENINLKTNYKLLAIVAIAVFFIIVMFIRRRKKA